MTNGETQCKLTKVSNALIYCGLEGHKPVSIEAELSLVLFIYNHQVV